MARKVKLQDTGEYGMSDVAYRAPNGKYYSSESAFKKIDLNKLYRQKCITAMYDVLGYKEGMIIPTYFYKELKTFEGVGYQALYLTMRRKIDDVGWAIKNKTFNGETAKVMYIMAIYKNSVMDTYKELIAEELRKKNTAKCEESVIVDIDTYDIGTKVTKKKDITSLIGDF